MVLEHGPHPQGTHILCRVCAAVNDASMSYCQNCWLPLDTNRVVSEVQRLRYEAIRKRRARVARWLSGLAIGTCAGLLVALVAFVVSSPAAAPPPAASTRISSASAPGEWAMDGYNLGHTRSVSLFHPPKEGRLKWRVTFNVTSLTAPVVVENTVYIASSDGHVIALDAATGEHRWLTQIESPVDSAPTVAGDGLYLALRDRRLLALDRKTGAVLWGLEGDGPLVASPIVVEGVVYALSSVAGTVFAIDAATGQELWRRTLKGSWTTSAASWARPILLVATGDHVFYIDTRTGKIVLVYKVPIGMAIGPPAVFEDSAYVAVSTGGVLRLALDARAPFWERYLLPGWRQFHIWGMAPRPPQPSGFVGVYPVRGRILAPPAITDDALFVGTSSGQVRALGRENKQGLWSYRTAGEIRGAPAVAGDMVYVGAGNHLYALTAQSGELVWSFQTAAAITTHVVVTSAAVYVVDQAGTLYAIE